MSAWLAGYTHVRDLGAGASGRVELATHDATGSLVAIKFLDPALGDDLVANFRAEARLLTEIDDDNVARLYEYAQLGDQAAIVLELVDGVSLQTMLDEHGPLTPEAALVVLKGSLLGLAAAHDHGVVHRDYKPANVMVTGSGATKLIDFGVAVRSGATVRSAGTPDYMAPEQWDGGAATTATDVYAATGVFVACLTAAPPFSATTIDALALQHRNAPPPADALPAAVRPLVTSGMAKNPRKRPVDARAFVVALEQVAANGYGEDWEERGRRDLGRRALLLAALFPTGAVAAGGFGALALTVLGHKRWLAVGGIVAAVVIGGAAVAVSGPTTRSVVAGPPAFATASATPSGATRPTPHAHPSGSPRPTGSTPRRRDHRRNHRRHPAPPTPDTSRTAPASGPTRPDPAPSAPHPGPHPVTQPATRPPTHSATRSAAPHPAPHPSSTHSTAKPPPAKTTVSIYKVSVSPTATNEGRASAEIIVNGPAPVKVVVDYSDGSQTSFTITSAQSPFSFSETHHYASCATDWGVTVSTVPTATDGSQSASTTGTC